MGNDDLTRASAASVRHRIAQAIVGSGASIPAKIGAITLRRRQHAAAARLTAAISHTGGALLAEPAGLGKTYTALAVAAHFGGALTVLAPSSLRVMWRQSMKRCGVCGSVVTHEMLSRGARTDSSFGFVIVDEAHRLRSPGTRRYAAAAELCKRARVLLVTATPVQNRRADLSVQLALFLGRRAWELRDHEIGMHVVRGGGNPSDIPKLNGPVRIELTPQDGCLGQLVALPPPIPARGESIAAVLLTYGLIHQWTSSRAALVAALNRRRARGLALLAALEAGRSPTRADLSAWTHAGDSVQLAFPELVTTQERSNDTDGNAGTDDLLIAVDRHNAALDGLLATLRSEADPDDERAAALRRIRAAHPGERIIAFCHYAETVSVLRGKLARDAGVAALTASGARVASGRVSRESVLEQFTPRNPGRPLAHAAERVDLLITTDLSSEGLNLQEASVVVHLDLPWNPARLEQRVGRVRRMESRFETVTVYAVAPPVASERLLHIERRLQDKLRLAQRTIGIAGCILPGQLAAETVGNGLAEQTGVVHEALSRWLDRPHGNAPEDPTARTWIGAVSSAVSGFLAVVRDEQGAQLIADDGHGISDATHNLLRAITVAEGDPTTPDERHAAEAVARIAHWLDARRGTAAIDLGAAATARWRRATLTRVAQTLARVPRHRRPQLTPLVDAARAVAVAPLGEGAERILDLLVKADLPDEAWLRSIATFGELNVRPSLEGSCSQRTPACVESVLLFQPVPL